MSAFFNSKVLQYALFYFKSLQCVLFRLQKFVVCAFFTSKACRVRFLDYKSFVVCAFLLQKFVECAFLDCKSFCRVRFFRLQKFVECAFQTTKVGSVHFFHYRVCSVCFLRLQKFVEFDVSEQLTLAKQLFIIQSLYPPENQVTLTNGKGQIVATAYGLENSQISEKQ